MDGDRSVMTSPGTQSRILSESTAASAVQTASQGRLLLLTAIICIIATWTIGFAAYWWYAAGQREDELVFYLGFCGLVTFIICAATGGAWWIIRTRMASSTRLPLSADPRLPTASDFPPGTAFVINEFDVPLVSIPDSGNKTVTWFNWYGGVPRVYDPSYLKQGNSWDAKSFEEWVGIVKESLDPGSVAAPAAESVKKGKEALPCCNVDARYVTELSHVYQFDLDLYQCGKCGRYWVRAWRMGIGGWENVTKEDAEKMRELPDEELRVFMRAWAGYLN